MEGDETLEIKAENWDLNMGSSVREAGHQVSPGCGQGVRSRVTQGTCIGSGFQEPVKGLVNKSPMCAVGCLYQEHALAHVPVQGHLHMRA